MADREKLLAYAEEAVVNARNWLWKADMAHARGGDLQDRGAMVGACADTADSWLRVAEWYRDAAEKALNSVAPARVRPAPTDT